MDPKKFTKPNGKIIKNAEGHDAFLPNPLPPQITYDEDLVMALVHAERKLAELKGIGDLLPNPNVLIRPYLTREAVSSSKIEGTLASVTDMLQFEAVGGFSEYESERLRLREVSNYIRVLRDKIQEIKDGRRIDLDMIGQSHHTLMHNVRGGDRHPGKFREVQNWIVKYGDSAENSVYTPPPPEFVMPLLKQLEQFLQNPPENLSVVMQCALLHYQFEAIHPFADGNGRIGRVLVSLLLAERGLLPQPLLYLSAYFERNLDRYYDGLLLISQESRWKEWLKFFFTAIIVTADEAIDRIQRLLALQKQYKEKLKEQHVSGNAVLLLDYLLGNPFITIPQASDYLQVSYPSAKSAVSRLVNTGILKEAHTHYRSKVFLAEKIADAIRI